MGRAARAGVRVGFCVRVCLCRERPPCEGFFLTVMAEVSGVKVRVFRVCRRVLLVASSSWPGERALGVSIFPEEGKNPKKGVTDTPF